MQKYFFFFFLSLKLHFKAVWKIVTQDLYALFHWVYNEMFSVQINFNVPLTEELILFLSVKILIVVVIIGIGNMNL